MTTSSYRRLLGFGMIIVLLALSPARLAADSRPNILYIFTDDQSRRSVSAYEQTHDWVRTPNIDSLAASGMRFTTCYTGASCQMSRSMMMTGLLQHAIQGFDTSRYPACDYDPELQPFWPAEFRRSGYKTAAIGKWHLGEDVGQGRDWDYPVGCEDATSLVEFKIIHLGGAPHSIGRPHCRLHPQPGTICR